MAFSPISLNRSYFALKKSNQYLETVVSEIVNGSYFERECLLFTPLIFFFFSFPARLHFHRV